MGANKLILKKLWMDLCCFIFCMGLPLLAVSVQLSLFQMGEEEENTDKRIQTNINEIQTKSRITFSA